jgi:hypothetical protein
LKLNLISPLTLKIREKRGDRKLILMIGAAAGDAEEKFEKVVDIFFYVYSLIYFQLENEQNIII